MTGEVEVLWQRPKPVELIIWDEVGSQFLLAALNPTSHHIIRVRSSSIYLHPFIVWGMLIGALTKRNTRYEVVIELFKPKVVVTFIDNDPTFHRLASRYSDVRFVAIQNGGRQGMSDEPLPIGPPATYDSEYFCFGQNEIDSYKVIGYQFKKMEAVGSLKNALFMQVMRDSTEGLYASERYDIVLISQFRRGISEPSPLLALVEYKEVVSFLYSYLESRPRLRVSVALVSNSDDPDHDAELLFHREGLGDTAILVPRSGDLMSGYLLTQQSDVVVAASSTLGFESLARGRKTLLCSSLYFEALADRPHFTDWTLLRADQDTFDEAITKLLAMPRETFLLRNRKSINYVMVAAREDSIPELKKKVLG